MTTRAPFGSLRHRLGKRMAGSRPPAPVTTSVAPAATGSLPVPGKWSPRVWLTGTAFRLYAFLSARRRQLLPLTTRAANVLDNHVILAPAGARLLRSMDRRLAEGSRMDDLLARVVSTTLAAAAQVHLAASRKPSALRAVRLLNLMFRSQIRARAGVGAQAYFTTLALCSAYDRIVREVPQPETIDSFAINFAAGVAHMYRGNLTLAAHFLEAAASSGDGNALRKLGAVHALAGDHAQAAACFKASVERDPRSVMAHQNYAGGYDPSTYTPGSWELENAGELLIYDNLIQLGENFYHQGRYDDTFRSYQAALDHQDALARRWSVPDKLVQRIAAASRIFDPTLPVRLLGYEWVTLIGHIGFIDCHLRMAAMGILPRANYVLLAPHNKVVNQPFLRLFEQHVTIIEDPGLVDELLPYQRLVGDQFIAVRGKDGLAEPWAHAASRAQVAWAEQQRGPLVTVSAELMEKGAGKLRAAGVTADWFVAIHIREGGYHGDGPGTTRQHRSANVGDYLEAITAITARGGAVVRLGDRSMTPLRGMAGVFDYAHSDIKSAEMDLYLCAAARLFVGTTSGLTTAVQALGTPMLLVNCISNDCQFWHERTDFTVRPVYDRRNRRYLSLRETYRQPLQALLIDTAVLARHGLEVHANTAQDVLEAVRYKLDCLDGIGQSMREGGPLLDRYRATLRDNPYNFGAALPVPAFLDRVPELLD
ncbi:TIGR04372 family glycosyltransferase [Bradyrhizobium sp. HKCCYLRH3099]|uniref:TIGR04372 family glycosyltransferase n=1 Tax=unclassified Bradyrhizobium TaxID=2631580 RepID=UPI003EBC1743